jgi:hypothetical protein
MAGSLVRAAISYILPFRYPANSFFMAIDRLPDGKTHGYTSILLLPNTNVVI